MNGPHLKNEDCPCRLHDCEGICPGESSCGEDLLDTIGLCRLAFAAILTIVCAAAGIRGAPAYIMAVAAIAAAGYDSIISGVRELIAAKRLNEIIIIILCCIGCLALGRCAEAAAAMTLYQAGKILKHIILYKSRESISSALDLRPDVVTVLKDGSITGLAASQAEPGTALIIKPGERAATDCMVTEGVSSVDSSEVSDRALPWMAGPGSEIPAGSLNLGSLLYVKTLRAFEDSDAARAIEAAEAANTSSSKLQRLISRVAAIYMPALVIVAVLLAFIPPLALRAPLGDWVRRALVLIAAASPCALIISIPLVYFAGISSAAQSGVLFRDSDTFDALTRAESIFCGSSAAPAAADFRVADMRPAGIGEASLLALAAHALCSSSHPYAAGVQRAYGRQIQSEKTSESEDFPGRGAQAKAMGNIVRAGSAEFVGESGAEIPEEDIAENSLYVSFGRRYMGRILFKDAAQDEAQQAIAELKELGIRRVVTADDAVLSEDTSEDGKNESALLGDLLSGAHARGKTVVYTGENEQCLNDADIGVAVSKEIPAAGGPSAALFRGGLRSIAGACACAKRAGRILAENLIIAGVIKAAVIVLALLGLAAVWFAVTAEICAAILVLLNSSRAFYEA